MNFFETTIGVEEHIAVAAPTQPQVAGQSSTGMALSSPNYLGGGAILLALVGIIVVARSASPASRRQRHVTELGKVHHANLLKNLEHRIEVAKEQGNQNLVNLLEQERGQIG